MEDLLADRLGDIKGLGLVARRVRREERRVLGHPADDQLEETIAIGPGRGGDGHDLGKRMAAPPRLDEREHPALGTDPIGLVQHAEDRPRVGAQRVEDDRVGAVPRRRVDDEADQVDVLDGAMRGLQHEVAELAVGRVQPGRIDEYHLRVRQILDAGDAVPGRLRPRGDDRELLTDQAVQKRGFPSVGPADERHESGAAGHHGDIGETETDGGESRRPCQSRAGGWRRPVERIWRSRSCIRRASTGSRSS